MTERSPETRKRPLVRVDRTGPGPRSVRGRGISGTRFVAGSIVALLVVWGGLYLLFLGWRSEVEGRIELGKLRVVPIAREFAAFSPPGIPPNAWDEAVADTEAMLDEVVGTGRIDRSGLDTLRENLLRKLERAGEAPDAAPGILADLWEEMAAVKRLRAETERPRVLEDASRARPSIPGSGRPGP